MQVNTLGVISFRLPYSAPPLPFPLSSSDVLIAPFLDIIDTLNGGRVLFRQTNDGDLLTQVGTTINEAMMADFFPTLLFIATWDSVADSEGQSFVRNLNPEYYYCGIINTPGVKNS